MSTIYIVAGTGLAFLLLTWLAIIDIAAKDFSSQPVKVGWGIAVALVPFIGCMAYFAFGARKGRKPGNFKESENNV